MWTTTFKVPPKTGQESTSSILITMKGKFQDTKRQKGPEAFILHFLPTKYSTSGTQVIKIHATPALCWEEDHISCLRSLRAQSRVFLWIARSNDQPWECLKALSS